ncbi:mitogen-activated protein kinase kinase, putative [Phytophthora infestans T30-4]|uniref:Mitogen-activated protein kinase kinase, putative n=1 Tax=Phytophthora infestans (strain T30-4) TaxID=403677 RepID=D0NJZ4_PHYIT|nr:mitogen-activated protein kinase kinase, putative [Phytophthora infestans T30-4]EEY59831.1 mitogen-activated protein kinase kinase, putative [Phytophthora infestans T30-4]|eukprot:XP_002900516.1 mitogen-activated protein kinase kinase, putative [Phytophthora infestans T30-4]
MKTPVSASDTCLYGSVVGMEKILALDLHDNQSMDPKATSPPSECDECEQRTAQVNCDECGLVYCSQCDVHRHRKGKLQLHQRVQITRKRVDAPELEEIQEQAENSTANWKNDDVCEWLKAHDLKLFVDEAQEQQITGATLLSPKGLERFLDAATGVSRGHKKKLQREVQKLQSSVKSPASIAKMTLLPTPSPPIQRPNTSVRRIGLNLRVDVEPAASKPPSRRGLGQLKIEVNEDNHAAISAPKRIAGGRQNAGSLGLDIAQVRKEEKTVAASFDFSATGRLQTQGFEIDTRGIANAPFSNSKQHSNNGSKPASAIEAISTKDYLLILEELGHGAGGKVYKALYMPTFRLVAVKVIRVYDQKKRHQMVRELKSLYVNFVPLATATFPSATSSATQAACEELVVFYDAYTNPELGSVSIVLEYMDGGSLEDYVQSACEEGGCLTEKEIANVAACGLKGLVFLHEHHQLHRDIKLSNMLINSQGQVKISDFGISRDLESTLAKATTFTGTLLYMAPERISGGMYSYPSDLWSFGLAVMACAIGKLPVPTKDGYWGVVHAVQEQPSPRLQDYGDHFSPELCDFLDQCLQKNPMYRPPAARLLEHPFIKNNYSLREQENVRLSRDQQPPTAKALERSRQELRNIADKAQIWCRDHADGVRGLSSQDMSTHNKVEALAKQLRLSVVEVASHFTFLDEYSAEDPCQLSDVLWLWSGALTSRSITFKVGLREGYTCVDSDFVLYAFPELLEGEKPHSSIATCSDVDSGEAGEGEVRSAASYDTPNVKECTLSDLPHSDRKYRYELTLLRTGETVRSGTFTTPREEGEPFNYRVAFASCADEMSDPEVFEEIRKENALFFMHTGDLHYHNLVVNNVAAFRDGYNSIFASPAGQAMLAMDVPFVYMWDDHDFGPDNSDSTAPGRNASVQAYHEFVPHYPLIGGRSRSSTVHQAFTIGRVRYLLTDLRSARTPNTARAAPTKTVLGKKQKAWFKSELVRATSDPNIRLIIWVNTMPWLDDERKWGHFVHEQQELVNFIKAHGLNKWVPIVIVSGDAHMLAVDDGSHSPGNLTVLHSAALGRPGSIKGGPYSHGAFPGSGQYAVMDVTDEGGEDGRVCLYYRGMNIYKGKLVEFDTCYPERTPPVTPYYPPPIPIRIMKRVFKKAKRYTGTAVFVLISVVALLVYRNKRHAVHTKKHS